MKKFIVIACVVLSVIGGALWWMESHKVSADTIPATIEDVKGMVKLCALEIHDDVPMKDSINGKWIFAKGRINGYITFDLEKMEYDVKGDTITVVLPPEKVEVYESTDKGAYRVYDAWDNTLFGKGELTTREENILKERMKRRFVDAVYSKGHVRRARATAVSTLSNLFTHLNGNVVIVDYYPGGYGVRGAENVKK